MSHDYVSTHCLNCGGFLGDVCVDCGKVSDGGEYMASNSDAWCHCNNSVSDFGCDAYGQPLDDEDAEQSVHTDPPSALVSAADADQPCEISRECYFGQDGLCLRGGECR